jgi:hypothetical protein
MLTQRYNTTAKLVYARFRGGVWRSTEQHRFRTYFENKRQANHNPRVEAQCSPPIGR